VKISRFGLSTVHFGAQVQRPRASAEWRRLPVPVSVRSRCPSLSDRELRSSLSFGRCYQPAESRWPVTLSKHGDRTALGLARPGRWNTGTPLTGRALGPASLPVSSGARPSRRAPTVTGRPRHPSFRTRTVDRCGCRAVIPRQNLGSSGYQCTPPGFLRVWPDGASASANARL
jgi:hypothetical protein